MAFRAPRYSHLNAARDVGSAAITLSTGTAHADFPVSNLVDDRQNSLFKFSGSVASPYIIVDLGTAFVTGISRLIIPRNHNIGEIVVQGDDNLAFTSPTTLHATDASVTPGVLVDLEFDTGASTERYIRVGLVGTAAFYLPQLYLTKIVTLTNGPDIRESVDAKRFNYARLVQPSGIAPTIQNGPAQRLLEYDYRYLVGADLTAMEALLSAVGMEKPFYVDPHSFSTPPKTDEPVLFMRLDEPPQPLNAIDVPMSGVRGKTVRLQLVESLD